MTQLDLIVPATAVLGIAEPHQSTVAAILHAVGQGVFTTAEAEVMIDRLRTVAPDVAEPAREAADQS